MLSYLHEVYFSNAAKNIANLNLLEPVYALYRKNAKVLLLAIPIIFQFIVASVQMIRASHWHNFNSYCNKPTSLMDVGLTACVFWNPSYSASVSVTFCSSRGSVVVAHAALLAATFKERNIAEGHAAVRLVVREGAWIVSSLIGQWSTFPFYTLFTTAIICILCRYRCCPIDICRRI